MWDEKRLKEIAVFNPRETLKKGAVAKRIAMEQLQPFCRDVSAFDFAAFNGGTKFRNGDTIMARITPCLENGKMAKINVLDEDEVGFGSTEYIVLRAREEIDEDFLYYLIYSSYVREAAIKSMVGSSGRQRVQTSVLENLLIRVPSYREQQKIGRILKDIDDKIASNRAINKNLEEQVSAIYQAWFEDFSCSDGIRPYEWTMFPLADIADVTSGKRPPVKSTYQTKETPIPILGASSIMGFTSAENYSDHILVIGRVGTHGIVQRFNGSCWASDNTLVIRSKFYEYVNQILQRVDYHAMNRGSTQPLITQSDIKNVAVLLPDHTTLSKFEKIAASLMAVYESNLLESTKLIALRDTLLPCLMSGELDVSNIEL